MCLGGLTGLGVCRRSGMTNRSDQSRRSPSIIRVLNRFRSVNRISFRYKSSPPYKYKGSRPIEGTTQSNLSKTYLLFLYLYPTFPTSTCYSSLVSMAFEDALAGLPSLGQPYTRSLVGSSPFCTATGLTGPSDRSDRSMQEVLQGAPLRSA